MKKHASERELGMEGEQPAGEKTVGKRVLSVLVAMLTALATLIMASPASAFIGSITIASADMKVSFFQTNADAAVNSSIADAKKTLLRNYAQTELSSNVTQASAIRVQFLTSGNPRTYAQAKNEINLGYSAAFNATYGDPVQSLATSSTSQWHLMHIHGPETDNATAWAIWNTNNDTDVINRATTSAYRNYASTNANYVTMDDVTEHATITKDSDGNVTAVTDNAVDWPGIYLLVETGTRDPNKTEESSTYGIKQSWPSATQTQATNIETILKRYAGNIAQMNVLRTQFINKSTGAVVTAKPNSTIYGSVTGRNLNIKSKATVATRSGWKVYRITSTNESSGGLWTTWNSSSDANVLNLAGNSNLIPGTVNVQDVTDSVTLTTDANNTLQSYSIPNISWPALYVFVEPGTATGGSTGGDTGGEDTGDTSGTHYGYAGKSGDMSGIYVSKDLPADADVGDIGKTADAMPAYCININKHVPYLNWGWDNKWHGVVTYQATNDVSKYESLLSDPNFTYADPRFKAIYDSTSSGDRATLIKQWIADIMYQTFSVDGIGSQLQTKYGVSDEQLCKSVAYAIHYMISYSMPNPTSEGKTYLETAYSNLTAGQKSLAEDVLKKVLEDVKSPSDGPNDSQIRLTLWQATPATQTVQSGEKEVQNLVTYRLPVKVHKIDQNGNDVSGKGLHMQILDSTGQVATDLDGNKCDWDNSASTQQAFLTAGTYTFREINAPNGYTGVKDIQFTIDTTGKITSITADPDNAGNEVKNQLEVTDQKTTTKTPIEINKLGANSAALSGAKLQILQNGSVVNDTVSGEAAEWTSDGSAHQIYLDAGTYTFHEVSAPSGYQKIADFNFTVDSNGNVTLPTSNIHVKADGTQLTVTDQLRPSINIKKTDENGNVLSGAELQITGSNISPITWTSGTSAKTLQLEPGTYTLSELTAPSGYEKFSPVTFTVADNGTVTSTSAGLSISSDGLTLTVSNRKTRTPIQINKVNSDGTPLPGATLEVYNFDNPSTPVDRWVSDGTPHSLTLNMGTYYLHEVDPPAGYTKFADYYFSVDSNGGISTMIGNSNVSASGTTITAKDTKERKNVQINKVDATGTALPGAQLEILSADGSTSIESWTSGSAPHPINLPAGTYIFRENSVPTNGHYQKVNDFTFTVDEAGNVTFKDANGVATTHDGATASVNVITVTDKTKPPVLINKVGSDTNNQALAGAKISIYKISAGSSELVYNGTTDGSAISLYLDEGKYFFYESEAPSGYEKISPFYFNVDANGNITSVENATSDVASIGSDNVLTVTDKKTPKTQINKIGSDTKASITGAQLQVLDSNNAVKYSWTSDGTAKTMELAAGTYTFHEVSAPTGYSKVDDFKFVVDANGNVTQFLDMDGNVISLNDIATKNGNVLTVTDKARVPVQFVKVGDSGESVTGAHFSIYKNGSNIAAESWISNGTPHFTYLDPNSTYTIKETQAPSGYDKITDSVIMTDANGRITKITGNSIAVSGSTVTITDKWNGEIQLRKRDYANHSKSLNATFDVWLEDSSSSTQIPDVTGHYGTKAGTVDLLNGQASLSGLKAGTYYIVETKAPDGYTELASPIKVQLSRASDGSSVVNVLETTNVGKLNPSNNSNIAEIVRDSSSGSNTVQIYNIQQITSLPVTGMSSGLIAWIVVGVFLVLALGAVVLSMLLKRRSE